MKRRLLILTLFLVLIPAVSFAQFGGPSGNAVSGSSCRSITDFKSFVGCLSTSIITPLVFLLMGLALVYFFIGVIKYIGKGGDDDDRRAARSMMIYGILGLFVMVSVWGLVKLVQDSFPLPSGMPQVTQFGS